MARTTYANVVYVDTLDLSPPPPRRRKGGQAEPLSPPITVRLPREAQQELDTLAHHLNTTRSWVVTTILTGALTDARVVLQKKIRHEIISASGYEECEMGCADCFERAHEMGLIRPEEHPRLFAYPFET